MNLIRKIISIYKRIKKDDFIMFAVDGGLGSVILVYAMALLAMERTGKKVKYDITWFENNSMDCDNKCSRKFTIKKLFPNIDFEIATSKEVKFYKAYLKYTNPKTWVYNDFVFKNKDPRYFMGYYSHYKYWMDSENLLQKNLDFSQWKLNEQNLRMKQKIENSEYSVAIHIRRGDFVNLGFCCLTRDYYVNAIKYIQQRIKTNISLYIFSNDFDYVKEEILPNIQDLNITFVDINDNDLGFYDMYLMSLCNSNIIANSTFSISSALLNKHSDKIVIAPNTWGYNIGKENINGQYDGIEESIQNPNWTILNYKTGDLIREKVALLNNKEVANV